MVTGAFTEADLGVACYHSKVGAVELYLNHLVDGAGEYVVVDMTAGSDSFASGLFTRFDMTFLVAEPTRKGSVRLPPVQGVRAGLRGLPEGGGQQGPRAGRRGLPARRGGRRPAGDGGALGLGPLRGEGPPGAVRCAGEGEPRDARRAEGRGGRGVRAARLGALHAADGALPPQEREELGTRRRGRTLRSRSTPASCCASRRPSTPDADRTCPHRLPPSRRPGPRTPDRSRPDPHPTPAGAGQRPPRPAPGPALLPRPGMARKSGTTRGSCPCPWTSVRSVPHATARPVSGNR